MGYEEVPTWVLGNNLETCDQVCGRVGGNCTAEAQNWVDSDVKMNALSSYLGLSCAATVNTALSAFNPSVSGTVCSYQAAAVMGSTCSAAPAPSTQRMCCCLNLAECQSVLGF